MKSNLVGHLRRCNSSLRKASWNNYKEFLRIVISSSNFSGSRSLLEFLEREDFTGLVEFADSISSTEYPTAHEHRVANQLAALIRKYPYPKGSVSFDPERKAMDLFLASEHRCKRVNQRFRLYRTYRCPHNGALQRATRWIAYVLGEINLPEIYDLCSFGPGASIGVHGNATSLMSKFLARDWTVSSCALGYARSVVGRDLYFSNLLLGERRDPYYVSDAVDVKDIFVSRAVLTDYNKIVFVPKTAKVLRTIAVEPLFNGYLQKGVDEFMRKRLKHVGLNLDDQSRNQEMAREGSLPGDDPYVTIDLSSASDSISIELCRYVLPDSWFDLLNHVRSSSYLIDGVLQPYHKFTTMGNGFCFPLETLIFASLCVAAYDESAIAHDFSVYGDDIIVRQSVAARVLELLKICGFRANPKKTFLSGPFRESCGADWFSGMDVRPMGLDYAFETVQDVIKFCNGASSKDWWKLVLSEGCDYLKTLVPKRLLFVRPVDGQDDSALTVDLPEFLCSPHARWDYSTQCWSWLEYITRPRADTSHVGAAGYSVVLMWAALTGAKSSMPFTRRRETSTNVRRVSHAGNLSSVDNAFKTSFLRLRDRRLLAKPAA